MKVKVYYICTTKIIQNGSMIKFKLFCKKSISINFNKVFQKSEYKRFQNNLPVAQNTNLRLCKCCLSVIIQIDLSSPGPTCPLNLHDTYGWMTSTCTWGIFESCLDKYPPPKNGDRHNELESCTQDFRNTAFIINDFTWGT